MARWQPHRAQIMRTAQKRGRALVVPTAKRVQAVAKRIAPKKTGLLRSSIRYRQRITANRVRAVVYVDLKYAAAQHNGATRHVITPKNFRWLKFYWERVNKVVYAKRVNHPGHKGNEYLWRPLERIARRRGFITTRRFVVRSDNPFL